MIHMSYTRDGKQKTRHEIYNFIVWYKETYDGNSPNTTEIAEAVELKSKSTVHMHLKKLVAEGKLYLHPHIEEKTARHIMVTGGSWKLDQTA